MIYTDDSEARVIRVALLRYFDIHTSLFLTQLDYLLDHSVNIRDGYHWIYRTYAEWAADIGLSQSTIQRIVRRLKRQGIVVCGRYNRFRYDRTTWFRLDYEVMSRMGLNIHHSCAGEKAMLAMQQAERGQAFAAGKSFPVPARLPAPDKLLTAADVDDGFDLSTSSARFLRPELQQKILRQHCGKKVNQA